MNHHNAARLKEFLTGLDPDRFNMQHWSNSAGFPSRDNRQTAACIAGWAAALALEDDPEQLNRVRSLRAQQPPLTDVEADAWELKQLAAGWLGISREQANGLFYPASPTRKYTTQEAIKAIETLEQTGDFKWIGFEYPRTNESRTQPD